MRFSIIIPVYNVEKYIRKCMETVMGQTFRDYEVIVVDDESPDGSMAIVAEFAQRYPGMITMIRQKNTRQGGARNRGVREARGEYLIFVDSDDYVSLNMLEAVDEQIRNHDCDIVSFKCALVTPEGRFLREDGLGQLQPGRYVPAQDKDVVLLPTGPVHKAFRRSFYLESGFAFPEKLLYEDAVTRLLYAKAADMVLCDMCLYYYVQSPNSSMRQKPSERMLDILKVTDLTLEMFRTHGVYEPFRDQMESALIGGIVYVLEFVNAADPSSDLQNQMMDYIQEKFPYYRENPALDEDVRRWIGLLQQRKFKQYHYRVIRVRECKQFLKRWEVFQKLNRLRKRLRDR